MSVRHRLLGGIRARRDRFSCPGPQKTRASRLAHTFATMTWRNRPERAARNVWLHWGAMNITNLNLLSWETNSLPHEGQNGAKKSLSKVTRCKQFGMS